MQTVIKPSQWVMSAVMRNGSFGLRCTCPYVSLFRPPVPQRSREVDEAHRHRDFICMKNPTTGETRTRFEETIAHPEYPLRMETPLKTFAEGMPKAELHLH